MDDCLAEDALHLTRSGFAARIACTLLFSL
jgi:hypothetical protein